MHYRFNDCLLDAGRRELVRSDVDVDIQPQVFDLLLYLIRHRERVVTKDELIDVIWKGRIVSDSTVSSRVAAARHAIGDSGKDQRLIRTIARIGLRFVGAVDEEPQPLSVKDSTEPRDAIGMVETRADGASSQVSTSLPKAAIAVMPFLNLSGIPEQGHFINGMIEDITTALAQFPWLSVVARGLLADVEGWSLEIKQRGCDIGVHYMLEGSVRWSEHRVRVTARLIETATGELLWAKRFDVWEEDSLDLQDHITASVVGAIGPKLERLEIDRARRTEPETRDPLQYYLLGMGRVYQWNRDGMRDALALFNRAIELDPELAPAYGMAAYCYIQRKSYGWIAHRDQETAECARLAQRAAAFAGDDAVALGKAAHAIASVAGDIDSGAEVIEQALKLNPNLATAWYVSGWIRLFLGERDVAAAHLGRALRLGTFDPLFFKMQAAVAYAHFFAGQYDDATAEAERALRARPSYLTAVRVAAAGHAFAGRIDRARELITRMHNLDPKLRLANLPELIPFRQAADAARWADALGKAGLPE